MVFAMSPTSPLQSLSPPAGNSRVGITLETFILEGLAGFPAATGAFTSLLNQIGLSAKLITARVRRAGLSNVLGGTGEINVQGEAVQKLDDEANETLIQALKRRGHCAAVASEELEDIRRISSESRAKYLVVFDPLDGSSNIDVNISIGTIFGVLRKHHEGEAQAEDFLRPGRELAAAGYILYGSSTMLVLTTSLQSGVHGFTYDPTVGEFYLSHENIRVPARGNTYSINEGNSVHWTPGTRAWAEHVKRDDKAAGYPYGARYVGSLVADAHRTILRGGIFAYPADRKSPAGKLRLLYEANPISFLMEAAGGKATSGGERILDIQPRDLHQRTPLIIGSTEDVATYEKFAAG